MGSKPATQQQTHVLARAVYIKDGHILLCRTVDCPENFYFLPGGHVENLETTEQAVIREFSEETGGICAIKRFLGCLENIFNPQHSFICHNHEYNFIYEVECDHLSLKEQLPQLEEHIRLEWQPIHQLSEIDFKPYVLANLLPEWLEFSNFCKLETWVEPTIKE